jgi:DNA replication protein DnaC
MSKHEEALTLFKPYLDNPELYKEVNDLLEQNPPQKMCPICATEQIKGILFYRGTIIFQSICQRCEEREQQIKTEEKKTKNKAYLQVHIERFLTLRGVPKRYLYANITDFDKVKLSTNGLFLSGARGTGKTHLACAIVKKEILESENYTSDIDKMPLFISIPDLLLEIRHSFKEGSETDEQDIINKYSSIDLLVLDDLGIEKTSEWSIQTLYTIIDRRYRDMKRTIITSNLTLKEIADKLDDRISSRIAGMCDGVTLKGADRRLKK